MKKVNQSEVNKSYKRCLAYFGMVSRGLDWDNVFEIPKTKILKRRCMQCLYGLQGSAS